MGCYVYDSESNQSYDLPFSLIVLKILMIYILKNMLINI